MGYSDAQSSEEILSPPTPLKKLKKYLGTITLEDLATPQAAMQYIMQARKLLEEKNKSTKLVKQQNRRFRQKIDTLQDLVIDLRKRCLLSEKAAEHIMVCFKKIF